MLARRHLLGFLAALILVVPVPAVAHVPARAEIACDPGGGNFSRTTRAGPHAILPGELVHLVSDFDGVRIQIGVVRPGIDDPVPVIVRASPYFSGGLEGDDMRSCDPRLVENFVPHGYAVAFVPVRGTADAGGCMDLMGPAERADLDQAVDWLGRQPWSNGNVGMIGLSYDGSTPWEVASLGNPHLKTIVPISGVNDLYHLMYREGVVESRGPAALNALYYSYGFEYSGRSVENRLAGAVCPESWEGLAASLHSSVTGERDPFGFWAERNSRPGVEHSYRGSVFLVQGLQDWNVDPGHQYPWVSDLEARGMYVKHLLGQWGHSYPDRGGPLLLRRDWADLLLDWFDHWLKGRTDVPLGPRVEVQDSSYRWRNEESWPPADAVTATYHLGAGGSLGTDTTAAEDRLVFAPAPLTCPVCTVWSTAALPAGLRAAGRPEVALTVTPTGPGGHVSVILLAGTRTIGRGQADLRFAQGGETSRPVVPGQPLEVRVRLEPLDAVVPPGQPLVLAVGQQTYGDHLPSVPTYPVVVHAGDGRSTLKIDVFARP